MSDANDACNVKVWGGDGGRRERVGRGCEEGEERVSLDCYLCLSCLSFLSA